MFHIVLLEPEIPPNTGNIARTCAATGSRLHLIRPLGFSIDEREIRRAGLDYWPLVDVQVYENIDDFFLKNSGANPYLLSTKAARCYTDVSYQNGDYLMFGKETKGLPEELLHERYDRAIRIPMIHEARSLNLANSVAVVLYEALRQTGFPNLQDQGHLSTAK